MLLLVCMWVWYCIVSWTFSALFCRPIPNAITLIENIFCGGAWGVMHVVGLDERKYWIGGLTVEKPFSHGTNDTCDI